MKEHEEYLTQLEIDNMNIDYRISKCNNIIDEDKKVLFYGYDTFRKDRDIPLIDVLGYSLDREIISDVMNHVMDTNYNDIGLIIANMNDYYFDYKIIKHVCNIYHIPLMLLSSYMNKRIIKEMKNERILNYNNISFLEELEELLLNINKKDDNKKVKYYGRYNSRIR